MPSLVQVTAPCRLHFGMLSFGHEGERQFGGVGVMIDRPPLVVRLSSADRVEAAGPLAERAATFVRQVLGALAPDEPKGCRVEIVSAPPEHCGLGVGTQLGLSIAAGAARLLGREASGPHELAAWAGRGQRSAVGTHGFALGGMIVEAGKRAGDALGTLVCRLDLPEAWRFVLVMPAADHENGQGLSGVEEQLAFASLPPVPQGVTDTLCREVLLHLLPAAREGRFDQFSASLYRYGYLAGLCFAAQQGGAYAGERLTHLVAMVRSLGVEGVGQSSWGPTLFALLPSQSEAEALVSKLRQLPDAAACELVIASASRHGALVEVSP